MRVAQRRPCHMIRSSGFGSRNHIYADALKTSFADPASAQADMA
jgi:hypothetical protein